MRYLIWILSFFFSLTAFALDDLHIPNLSVDIPNSVQGLNPAQRQRAFELNGVPTKYRHLDTLDQDRIFLRDFSQWQEYTRESSTPQSKTTGKTILFLDLNFAPSEIKAAKAAAESRGDRFLIYPERTEAQQNEIENIYRRLIATAERYKKCSLEATKDCSALRLEIENLRAQVEDKLAAIPRLDSDAFRKIVADLHQKHVQLSAIVFSGHSAGNGTFAGLFGFLDIENIVAAFVGHEDTIHSLKSILLWGCYSGSLHSLHEVWQAGFPNVKSFMGYRNQAPLGIRDSSGTLLKSYLQNETRFISAATPREAHRVFRAFQLVADLDGAAAAGDYYYTYERAAAIDALIKICENFDEKLLDGYRCYQFGQPGCENPPADHQGPLRQFYNFLQTNRHCQDVLMQKYGWMPPPESVIRLIYVQNVKENFKLHYENKFATFNQMAADFGLSARIDSLIKSTRAQDIEVLQIADNEISKHGGRDFTYVDLPNWRDILSVNGSLTSFRFILGLIEIYPGSCVPFTWIEPNAKEPDSCGFGRYLTRPTTAVTENYLLEQYFRDREFRLFRHSEPALSDPGYVRLESLAEFKESRETSIGAQISTIEGFSDRSQEELSVLDFLRKNLADSKVQTAEAVRDQAIRGAQAALMEIDRMIVEAEAMPNSQSAVSTLKSNKEWIKNGIEILRKL